LINQKIVSASGEYYGRIRRMFDELVISDTERNRSHMETLLGEIRANCKAEVYDEYDHLYREFKQVADETKALNIKKTP